MMVFKRRQVVVVALVAMISIAGYLNWRYTANVNSTTVDNALGEALFVSGTNIEESSDNKDYFVQARLDRETGRSKAIETLNGIINNESADKTAKSKAAADVAAIAKNTEIETQIESLIKAKGFSDTVVYLNDGNASVVVKSAGLTSQEAARIQEIVMTNAGVNAEAVKIVEVK